MSIKSDRWIKKMALEHGMNRPVRGAAGARRGRVVRRVVVRLRHPGSPTEFKIFTNINTTVIEPEALRPTLLRRSQGRRLHRPAHSFALARTVEYFRIPRNVLTICWASPPMPLRDHRQRDALRARVGGHGHARESRTRTPLPAKIYANEGIAQVLFFESDELCEISYGDKQGKYLRQREVTLPRI